MHILTFRKISLKGKQGIITALSKELLASTYMADKLRSYRSAMRDLGCAKKQDTGRLLNNRAEIHIPHSDDENINAAISKTWDSRKVRINSRTNLQSF